MLTTIFPREVSRFQRLRGSKKIVERSKLLVEKYPKLSRKMSVDALIAAHTLLGAAFNPKKNCYSAEQLESMWWEIYHDYQLRRNEKRLAAERDSALILATFSDRMNPLLTGKKRPDYLHKELAELGLYSMEMLERFIDESPRRVDGYRGLIERIGNICYERSNAEDILPMLQNSLDIVKKMDLSNDEKVGSQLYIMHSSIHRAEKIISVLGEQKIFENTDIEDLRKTIITIYINRGIITMDGASDLNRACMVIESFEILDDELIRSIREKTMDVGTDILHKIVDVHMRLSDTLQMKKGAEILSCLVKEIKKATTSLKR